MSKRLTRRVLLIGWDAADWQIIHPLMEAGKLPVLQRLIEYGTSGSLATLQPPLSPILWNSIATGKRADKHGILGFREPTPDGTDVRPVSSTSRRAKALWNILSQQGLRSDIVNWFASHPAEPVAGTVFSDRLTNTALGDDGQLLPLPASAVYPPELLQTADDLRVHPGEITLQQSLAFFEVEHLPDPQDPRFNLLVRTLAQCATTHNAATWLAARDDWDFMAVYYEAIDHVGHGFIEYHPPAMAHVSAQDAAVYGQVVTNMYRFHDMLLGALMDLAGPESTIILMSDHGFYNDHLRPTVAEHSRDLDAKFGIERNPVAWHRQQGVLVAAGKCIKHDELIHGANLLDIAPTVLALLGQPVPDDMDGRVLTQLFKEPPEIERIASYEEPHPHDGIHRDVPDEEMDPFAARAAMQQLADLGYIDLPADGDKAKEVIDTDRDRRYHLAQVYFSTGRMRKAVELFQGLLDERDTADLRCNLALCYFNLNNLPAAEAVLDTVSVETMPSPLPRLIMGRVRLSQDRLEEALALLRPLEQEHYPFSYLHTTLGQVYARRGMRAEAEAAFRRALERDADNAEAHDALGTVLRRQGRFEEAVEHHLRSAVLHHVRPTTHVNLGIALTRTGQYDWAIRAFEVALELSPDYLLAHRSLGHLYRRIKNDDAKADAHFARVQTLLHERQAAAAAN